MDWEVDWEIIDSPCIHSGITSPMLSGSAFLHGCVRMQLMTSWMGSFRITSERRHFREQGVCFAFLVKVFTISLKTALLFSWGKVQQLPWHRNDQRKLQQPLKSRFVMDFILRWIWTTNRVRYVKCNGEGCGYMGWIGIPNQNPVFFPFHGLSLIGWVEIQNQEMVVAK